MAHHTEQQGFPPIPLVAGMKLRLRALSATTDAAVAGVTCSQWAIYGYDVSETSGILEAFELPLLTPLELTESRNGGGASATPAAAE